ncbi:MAG: hypothetical protein WC758_04180 [Candidatus Woesearchaeota archaeon]|jgi:hypothetical protein
MNYNNLTKVYDSACLKTAGVVGTGIHLYSVMLSASHFQGILDDFSNGHYIQGTLKAVFPYVLPYAVSLYSRREAKRSLVKKISEKRIQFDSKSNTYDFQRAGNQGAVDALDSLLEEL